MELAMQRLSIGSSRSIESAGRTRRYSTNSVLGRESSNVAPELTEAMSDVKRLRLSVALEHGIILDSLSQDLGEPEPANGARRASLSLQGKAGNKSGVSAARELSSSRSASPSAPFSVTSEQGRTPTSPTSPVYTSLPQYPSSPSQQKMHDRDGSKSFFQNLTASKSSAKIQPGETTTTTIRQVSHDLQAEQSTPTGPRRSKSASDLGGTETTDLLAQVASLNRAESSPSNVYNEETGSALMSQHAIPRRPVGAPHQSRTNFSYVTLPHLPASSESSQHTESGAEVPEHHRGNHKFSSFFKRNLPSRGEDSTQHKPESSHGKTSSRDRDHSETRNKGIDGHARTTSTPSAPVAKDSASTGGLFSSLKSGKGIFFRGKQPPKPESHNDIYYDSTAPLTVLNKPLADQVRASRLCPLMEYAVDKTDFWLPAIAYRCISFLTKYATESEGLYRVPGSEREVRMWKARFDAERDVDLLEAYDKGELNDINTVSSLLKSWLRDLPDELFPRGMQDKFVAHFKGQKAAPTVLRKYLSKLPPQKYYLLFSITCHLGRVVEAEAQTKMNLSNLFVCIGSSLRLHSDPFNWLVGDWKGSWGDVMNSVELDALQREYDICQTPDEDRLQALEYLKSEHGADNNSTFPVDLTPALMREVVEHRHAVAEKERITKNNKRAAQASSSRGQGQKTSSKPSTGPKAPSAGYDSEKLVSGPVGISKDNLEEISRRFATGSSSKDRERNLGLPPGNDKLQQPETGDLKAERAKKFRDMPVDLSMQRQMSGSSTEQSSEEKDAIDTRAPHQRQAYAHPRTPEPQSPKQSTTPRRQEDDMIQNQQHSSPRGLRPQKQNVQHLRLSPTPYSHTYDSSGNTIKASSSMQGPYGNMRTNRSNSQLPELDFPPEISPTFTNNHYKDV